MAKMMFRPMMLMVFLFLVLLFRGDGMKLVKRAADVEEEEVAPEIEPGDKEEEAVEENESKAQPDVEAEAELELEPEPEEELEPEPEELEPESSDDNDAEKEPEPQPDDKTEPEPESSADDDAEEEPELPVDVDVEPEKIPELEPEQTGDSADTDKGDSDEGEDSSPDGDSEDPKPSQDDDEESNEVDSDKPIVDLDSVDDDDDNNEEEFPFQGGFAFDSPFFSFEQVENYFRNLERAMEAIFRKTMASIGGQDTYENSTDQIVEIDGRKYRVHTTVIRGGNANNAVSIEAVSAVPAYKRKKRSLF